MNKKIIAGIMSVAMLATMSATPIMAEEVRTAVLSGSQFSFGVKGLAEPNDIPTEGKITSHGVTYTINGNTFTGDNHAVYTLNSEKNEFALTKGAVNPDGSFTIPGAIVINNDTNDYIPVTSIADNAFENKTELKTVKMKQCQGDNLVSIGSNAFKGCINLNNIVFESTPSIHQTAFDGCSSLDKITVNHLDEDLTKSINNLKNFKNIIFADTVQRIPDNAFKDNTNITNIDICKIAYIEKSAFEGCTNLKSVKTADGSVCYIQTIGEKAFAGCSGLKRFYLYSQRNLGPYNIASKIQSIGENAFNGCENLIIVYDGYRDKSLPEGGSLLDGEKTWADLINRSIGTKNDLDNGDAIPVFCLKEDNETPPLNITFTVDKNNNIRIAEGSDKPIGEIDIPANLADGEKVYLDDSTFSKPNQITQINIPKDVDIALGTNFNNYTALTAFDVNPYNLYISSDDNGVLFNKDKTTLIAYPPAKKGDYTVPDSVITINDYAFADSKITGIAFSNDSKLQTIGHYAFSNSSQLSSIELPETTKRIGQRAFQNYENLTTIKFRNTDPTKIDYIDRYVLASDSNTTITIGDIDYTGINKLDANLTVKAINWNKTGEMITVPTTIGGVPVDFTDVAGKNAFKGCGATSVRIVGTGRVTEEFIPTAATNVIIAETIKGIENDVLNGKTVTFEGKPSQWKEIKGNYTGEVICKKSDVVTPEPGNPDDNGNENNNPSNPDNKPSYDYEPTPDIIVDTSTDDFADGGNVNISGFDGVPDDLKTKYGSVRDMMKYTKQAIAEYFEKAFKNIKFNADNTVFFDAELKPDADGKIYLPVPKNVDATKNKFVVAHIMKDGDIEVVEGKVTENGIEVTLNGLSPVMITWFSSDLSAGEGMVEVEETI